MDVLQRAMIKKQTEKNNTYLAQPVVYAVLSEILELSPCYVEILRIMSLRVDYLTNDHRLAV